MRSQSVLVVRHLGNVQAANAQTAAVVGILRVTLYLDELSVLVSVQQNAATIVATGARPGAAARDREPVLLVAPRLLMRYLDEVSHQLRGNATVVITLDSMFRHFASPLISLRHNRRAPCERPACGIFPRW